MSDECGYVRRCPECWERYSCESAMNARAEGRRDGLEEARRLASEVDEWADNENEHAMAAGATEVIDKIDDAIRALAEKEENDVQ